MQTKKRGRFPASPLSWCVLWVLVDQVRDGLGVAHIGVIFKAGHKAVKVLGLSQNRGKRLNCVLAVFVGEFVQVCFAVCVAVGLVGCLVVHGF